MNVGIVTLPPIGNYGGILQAHALGHIIRTLGHDVYYIRNKRPYTLLQKIKRLKNKSKQKEAISRGESQFLLQYASTYLEQTIDIVDKSPDNNVGLDILIVGSDQVWRNWSGTWDIGFYFCDFATHWDVKRYSYAASFGLDSFYTTQKDSIKIKNLIRLFDGISVREQDAINICHEMFNCEAHRHLDPTMLLPPDFYASLEHVNVQNTDMVSFLLDPTPEKEAILTTVKQQFGNYLSLNEKIKNNYSLVLPPIERWLSLFLGCKFIITDSFHGVAFAINFGKPFVVLSNQLRGLSRINSLLKIFGLERRLAHNVEDALLAINEKIDWEYVSNIKEKERVESLNYIKKMLI